MMDKKIVFVVFATLGCVLLTSALEVDTYDFLMPNVYPHMWYTDYKCRLLNRLKQIRHNQRGTGGGPGVPTSLSPLEERIAALLDAGTEAVGRSGTPQNEVQINPLSPAHHAVSPLPALPNSPLPALPDYVTLSLPTSFALPSDGIEHAPTPNNSININEDIIVDVTPTVTQHITHFTESEQGATRQRRSNNPRRRRRQSPPPTSELDQAQNTLANIEKSRIEVERLVAEGYAKMADAMNRMADAANKSADAQCRIAEALANINSSLDELYLCTPIRISPHSNYYVVGFEPNATMNTAHHMLLYGCSEPGSNESVWSCGEMQNNEIDKLYNTASPCRSGSQIVYAWARDAPSLHLPKDVGFLIGKDSPIKYLVLQVHYMHRFPEGTLDNSGVFLKYTKQSMPRQAGVILLGTSGVILPHRVENMETACTINEYKVIHPFAFRTHTHALGKLVSGYVVRQAEQGDVWTLLGKKNPQLPQMFYPVASTMPIEKDDVLAARCIMNNTNDHPVKIGATNKDEMCNFYLMYWVENDTPLDQKYCFSAGPPYYYWSSARENLVNIPLREI